MILSELREDDLVGRLRGDGLSLHIAPFVVRVRSPIPAIASGLREHYGDYPLAPAASFADFHVAICNPVLLRRWFRPQARFVLDEDEPFKPLPLSQAFALFEWGLNWCVAQHCHSFLVVHAAVLERAGHAVILPGAPGAGKSTLCAGLASRGWRLLSDELAIIDPADGSLVPMPRPISLKNESIEIIRRFAPQAHIGTPIPDTRKGELAHVKPPADSVERAAELARPAWIVFPSYHSGAAASFQPAPKGPAFMRLTGFSFNYQTLGEEGFVTLARLVDGCACMDFRYGDLDEATAAFAALRPQEAPC